MKFIITWDAGYGESAEVVEAEDKEKALRMAYEAWREEAESQANYSAEDYSEELAEDYGL